MSDRRKRPPRASLTEEEREIERAKQRAYHRKKLGTWTCRVCGGPMGIGRRQDGECRPCAMARTAKARERVAELKTQGKTIAAIAAELGLPRSTVSSYVDDLRAAGREFEPRHGTNIDDQVIALWAEGLTVREVGERLGISQSAAGTRIMRLRRKGYDLPRRLPPS